MPSGTRLPDRCSIRARTCISRSRCRTDGRDAFETGVFVETSPSADDEHAGAHGVSLPSEVQARRVAPLPVSRQRERSSTRSSSSRATSSSGRRSPSRPFSSVTSRRFEMSFNPGIRNRPQGTGCGLVAGVRAVGEGRVASRTVGLAGRRVLRRNRLHQTLRAASRAASPGLSGRSISASRSGWDLNIGVGRGLTGGSEHWVVKTIVGRAFPPR